MRGAEAGHERIKGIFGPDHCSMPAVTQSDHICYAGHTGVIAYHDIVVYVPVHILRPGQRVTIGGDRNHREQYRAIDVLHRKISQLDEVNDPAESKNVIAADCGPISVELERII